MKHCSNTQPALIISPRRKIADVVPVLGCVFKPYRALMLIIMLEIVDVTVTVKRCEAARVQE